MDVTIVRFANGSTLTFKRTEFERGSVQVRLRFGRGMAGIAPDRPVARPGWPAWSRRRASPVSTSTAMERLLTGRRIGLAFAVDEDAFVLAGQTNAADLADQLRLLATKLVAPRWDPALFAALPDRRGGELRARISPRPRRAPAASSAA